MEVSLEMRGDIGVLTIIGRLDIYEALEFKETIIKYSEKTCNFVLDLGDCPSLGEEGLAVIVSFLRMVSDKGGDVRIANLSKHVRMVFETTRAHKIFDIFDDVDTAVSSYKAD